MKSSEEQSLYEEMNAAIRGDRERAEKRAETKQTYPLSTSPPATPAPRRPSGWRRLFGGSREHS
jgi:hypothetical protein